MFTISTCGQMKIYMQFFHHITNSDSPSVSWPVFVVTIYSDPTYFQRGLQKGIKKKRTLLKTKILISGLLATDHSSRTALNFPRRWIGRGGPIAWPPHFADLSPLDFY
jgi:hypothetical protein